MSKEQEMLNKIKNEIAAPMHEWNPPPIERQYILTVHVKTAQPIANIDYTIRQITAVQDVFVKEAFE